LGAGGREFESRRPDSWKRLEQADHIDSSDPLDSCSQPCVAGDIADHYQQRTEALVEREHGDAGLQVVKAKPTAAFQPQKIRMPKLHADADKVEIIETEFQGHDADAAFS
jgi:hypothetical protein